MKMAHGSLGRSDCDHFRDESTPFRNIMLDNKCGLFVNPLATRGFLAWFYYLGLWSCRRLIHSPEPRSQPTTESDADRFPKCLKCLQSLHFKHFQHLGTLDSVFPFDLLILWASLWLSVGISRFSHVKLIMLHANDGNSWPHSNMCISAGSRIVSEGSAS